MLISAFYYFIVLSLNWVCLWKTLVKNSQSWIQPSNPNLKRQSVKSRLLSTYQTSLWIPLRCSWTERQVFLVPTWCIVLGRCWPKRLPTPKTNITSRTTSKMVDKLDKMVRILKFPKYFRLRVGPRSSGWRFRCWPGALNKWVAS
jgi:hypothetical protein